MISFESLRTPKPMDITVVWEGQDLHVTYDRAAFTIEMTENIYSMPIRERMSRVLLGWDLLKAGQPWQPLPKDDPSWYAIDAEPASWEERETAYRAAWAAILLQLDRTFVRAVDTGVLDDFLGVSWRGAISANGSAAAGALGGSTGGTNI